MRRRGRWSLLAVLAMMTAVSLVAESGTVARAALAARTARTARTASPTFSGVFIVSYSISPFPIVRTPIVVDGRSDHAGSTVPRQAANGAWTGFDFSSAAHPAPSGSTSSVGVSLHDSDFGVPRSSSDAASIGPSGFGGVVTVSMRGITCSLVAGKVDVEEWSTDPEGRPLHVAFDIRSALCRDPRFAVSFGIGDLAVRYDSAVPFSGVDATLSSPALSGSVAAGRPTVEGSVGFTWFGADPATLRLRSDDLDSRVVSDGCAEQVVAPGTSCTVTVQSLAARDGQGRLAGFVLDVPHGSFPVSLEVEGAPVDLRGGFVGMAARRVLDTRRGVGGPRARVAPGQVVGLRTTGPGLVPSGAASLVALSVTAIDPSAATNLMAWASGTPRPSVTSLNAAAHESVTGLVLAPVGPDGRVQLGNGLGSTDLVVDLVGWVVGAASVDATSVSPTRIVPVHQVRIVDTVLDARHPNVSTRLRQGGFEVDWPGFVAEVTVWTPSTSGYLRAGSPSDAHGSFSALSFGAGRTVSSTVLYQGSGGVGVQLMGSATARVTVDLVAVLGPMKSNGLVVTPVAAARVVDTRSGTGLTTLGAQQRADVQLPASVTGVNVFGLVHTLTALRPSATTVLSAVPSGDTATRTVALAAQRIETHNALQLSTYRAEGGAGRDAFAVTNSSGAVDVLSDAVAVLTASPSAAQTAGFPAPAFSPLDICAMARPTTSC